MGGGRFRHPVPNQPTSKVQFLLGFRPLDLENVGECKILTRIKKKNIEIFTFLGDVLADFSIEDASPCPPALIQKMTPYTLSKKKSHLFGGHVDPLFRCPRSKNWIKWEPDTHKWVSQHLPIRSRVSFDSPDSSNDLRKYFIYGCHDTLLWVSGSHLIPFLGILGHQNKGSKWPLKVTPEKVRFFTK